MTRQTAFEPLPASVLLTHVFIVIESRLGCLPFEWFALPRFGAEPKDIPVNVFDLHLVGPGAIRGFLKNLDASALEGIKKRGVFQPDPNPGSPASPAVFAQHDAASVAGYGTYRVPLIGSPIHRKTESLGIEANAAPDVFHSQHRYDALHFTLWNIHGANLQGLTLRIRRQRASMERSDIACQRQPEGHHRRRW